MGKKMIFVSIDENNRVTGYRSGSYTIENKNENEIVFNDDEFDWSSIAWCILNPETGETICDEICQSARNELSMSTSI